MKSIQELYSEIMASQELKAQFIEAANAGKQEAFLKEHGCEATMEEVKAFLEAKQKGDAPLSIDELAGASGGACNGSTAAEGVLSALTIGTYCAAKAIVSATKPNTHIGQENDDEGRLCNKD